MKKRNKIYLKAFFILSTALGLSLGLSRCGVYQGYAVAGKVVPYTFVSVSNFGNTTFMSFYLQNDGTLVPSSDILATGTISSSPSAVVVGPGNAFLYVAMFNSSNIAVYAVAPMTVAYPSVLTQIAPTSTFSAGSGTTSVALAPSGKFLYATSYYLGTNNVLSYQIASTTGALTQIGTDSASVNPSWIAIHPKGNLAYVTNQGSSNISAFSIDASSGDIAALGIGPYDTDATPVHAVIDPTGATLIVANTDANTLTTYQINSTTGALTSSADIATGSSPVQIALHPTKNFVYVANTDSDSISGFTLDPTTGSLTAMASSPFTLTGQTAPYGIAIDPTGSFLLATWTGVGALTVFSIDPTSGALTSVGSAQTVGVNPKSLVVYQLPQNE